MSRSAHSAYDIEAGIRVVRIRKNQLCTACCVVFFLLSLLCAVAITTVLCYFYHGRQVDVKPTDDDGLDTLRVEYEALIKIREELRLELKLIFENIENVKIGKPQVIKKHKSRSWFAHWKWFLGGLCGGLFFGSRSGCESDGKLQDNWKLAKNLRSSGFGEQEQASCTSLGTPTSTGGTVVGCYGGSDVVMTQVPKDRPAARKCDKPFVLGSDGECECPDPLVSKGDTCVEPDEPKPAEVDCSGNHQRCIPGEEDTWSEFILKHPENASKCTGKIPEPKLCRAKVKPKTTCTGSWGKCVDGKKEWIVATRGDECPWKGQTKTCAPATPKGNQYDHYQSGGDEAPQGPDDRHLTVGWESNGERYVGDITGLIR